MKKIEEYEMGQIQSLVFGALQKSEVCEDATELTEVTPIVLRRMYFKFGEKPTTGILEKYAKLDSDNLTLGCLHCGEDIGTTYSTSWQRIKLALLKEYNPIENYDRIQQDERNVSDDNTHSEGKRTDKVGAQDYDYGATQFTKGAEKITNGAAIDIHSNDVSAFNSSNYEPSARATDDIAQRVEDIDARIDSTIAYTNTVGVRSDEKVLRQMKIITDTKIYSIHISTGILV